MLRYLGRLVGLAVLTIAMFMGGCAGGDGGTSRDSATITDYRANFTVDSKGLLKSEETYEVNFPTSKHGIFRFFDTWDADTEYDRAIPEKIQVLRNGKREKFQMNSEGRGRYQVAKIGHEDITHTGDQTYQMSYQVKGALFPGDKKDTTQFYWDVIPGGWAMRIDKATIVVELPTEATAVECHLGAGKTGGCEAKGEGTKTLTIHAQDLAPNTPVTVRTQLDMKPPGTNSKLWKSSLDPVLGRSFFLLLLVLLLAGVAGYYGLKLSRSVREEEPGFPLTYAPPANLSPAQAVYVMTEKLPQETFVAAIMDGADKGAVELEETKSGWKLTGLGDGSAWDQTDAITQNVASALGIRGEGNSFTANPGSVKAGKKLKRVLELHESQVRQWGLSSGNLERSGLGPRGELVIWGLGIGAVALAVWNPLNMAVLALIPGLFAIGGIEAGTEEAGTRRTSQGRRLWSEVGGFHRILSTDSAEARFDFSGRKELYTAYIPWAVAFGCADKWAEKYQLETGELPPTPTYFASGFAAGAMTGFVSDVAASFEKAVSSSISAYESSQSSSSSRGGGGGGFGGGGGGGGGGGSW